MIHLWNWKTCLMEELFNVHLTITKEKRIMKLTFRYIIFAAMAVSAVFVSCSKELGNVDLYEGQPDGVRVISAGFDNSTKVSISGNSLSFQNGDLIRVSDNSKSEVCTLKVVDSKATFETTLQGEVTAIYPSDAAFLSSSDADAPIVSPWFKVPANQDGTIAKAVIAKATIAKGDLTATFRNQTALFQITPPSTAKQIIIKSLKPVVNDKDRTGTAAEINTEGTNKTVITVGDGSANLSSPIYVAFVPGVNLTDLSFDAGETIGMKGIPTSKLGSYSDATVVNTKYIINNTNWHPYVIIGGLKWATMNVGASTVAGSYTTCCGDMYQWGSLNTLYTENGIQWSSGNGTSISWKPDKGSGFVLSNMEYTNFSASLPGDKDVVKQEWGSDWRMPTSQEFKDLYDACGGTYSSSSNPASVGKGVYLCNYDGVMGCLFYDSTNKLFFPAEGWGLDTNIKDVGSCGHYWTTSTSENYACYMRFISGEFNWQFTGVSSNVNYFGLTIRPVADCDNFKFESYTDNGTF